MREILFRGKKVSDGEWIEGYYQLIPDEFSSESRAFITKFKKFDDKSIVMAEQAEVIPETVGQYTGLTDKNGKKIFEGDIIKSNGNGIAISVVKYGGFKPKMFFELLERYVLGADIKEKIIGLYAESLKGEQMYITDASRIIEVIGNIHDNPELLKGGADND